MTSNLQQPDDHIDGIDHGRIASIIVTQPHPHDCTRQTITAIDDREPSAQLDTLTIPAKPDGDGWSMWSFTNADDVTVHVELSPTMVAALQRLLCPTGFRVPEPSRN